MYVYCISVALCTKPTSTCLACSVVPDTRCIVLCCQMSDVYLCHSLFSGSRCQMYLYVFHCFKAQLYIKLVQRVCMPDVHFVHFCVNLFHRFSTK